MVVVPFFIADGLHSYQDIPVLLGMAKEPGKALSEDDVFRQNPIEMHGRQALSERAYASLTNAERKILRARRERKTAASK